MLRRSWFVLLLLPPLAACDLTSVPQDPAVEAPTTKASGRITGLTTLPTSLKPVYNGKTRGASVPVTNGAFQITLPGANDMNAIAGAITDRKFGDDADCTGTVTYSNSSAKVVFLTYVDLFRGTTFVGYAAGGQVQGDTVNTYTWIYATAPSEVRLQEACTQNGAATTDTVHLRLVAGWNSTVTQDTKTSDGRVVKTWYTQQVGEVPFVLVGTGTAPASLR